MKKFSASRQHLIGHVSISDYKLSVVAKDKKISGLLDGYEVLYGSANKKGSDNFSKAFSFFLNQLSKKSYVENITLYESEWDNEKYNNLKLFENVVASLKETTEERRIIIKPDPVEKRDIHPDVAPSFKVDQAINPQDMCSNVSLLGVKIDKACKSLNDLVHQGVMLSRRQLVTTMWGAKTVQGIIDSMKEEIIEKKVEWDKAEFFKDLMNKAIMRFCYKFNVCSEEICAEEQKVIANLIIPDIIKNYEKLKDMIIKALVILGPLVYIDEAFQKYTNYPASWFFTEEAISDLQEEYENLMKFISIVPKIESKVIDPLDFLRLQMLNY